MKLLGHEYRLVGTVLEVRELHSSLDYAVSPWRTVTDKERGRIGYPERALIDGFYIDEMRKKLSAVPA